MLLEVYFRKYSERSDFEVKLRKTNFFKIILFERQ